MLARLTDLRAGLGLEPKAAKTRIVHLAERNPGFDGFAGAIMTSVTRDDSADSVRLRAFTENDLPFLDRLCTDPDVLGEFEWPGFTDPRARRRRWERDGYLSDDSSAVAIVCGDGTVAGIATWKPRGFPAGVTYEIGVGVAPEHRGQGIGTAAQELLVEYLLDHTTAHRIEALTNDANVAEQKALERLGFRQEGLMRGRSFLHGKYVGVLVYGLLRADRRPEA